jgi:hypothetical protein
LVLSLITEKFEGDVIGGIISPRKGHFNVFLWHCTGEEPDLRLRICSQLCRLLNLPIGVRIDYTAHTSMINVEDGGRQTIHYIYEEEGPVEMHLPPRHRGSDPKEEVPA